MRALLDVNFLVALLDPNHASHQRAVKWLQTNSSFGWASCPLTENGTVRVLSSSKYANPLSAQQTIRGLRSLGAGYDYEFWADDLSLTDATAFQMATLQGHQQITDAYLLALAVKHRARVVTFDRRFPVVVVVGAKPEHLVVLEA